MTTLILPQHPEFRETLDNAHIFFKAKEGVALVQDAETGLYREATAKEVFDYAYGGELDECCDRFGDDELGDDWD